MAKKVFLGVGHGGSDPGASGNGLKEKDLTLSIAKYCNAALKAAGVNTKMSRTKNEDDTVTEEINECNAYKPDLAADIHINAGGGDGAEVFYSVVGGTGKKLATNINNEIKKIGQNSRGIKTRSNSSGSDYYGFIRATNAPAVIVECAFIDTKKDIAIIDTKAEQKKMGEAIAKGILATLGVKASAATKDPAPTKKPTTTKKPTKKSFLVRVKVSALNIRAGASIKSEIKGVIRDKGTYTIIEESGDWGKLKSGSGWININKVYVTRV